MQTQPHLLLLQKTMVMVEGIATQLHPAINMWDISGPYVKDWIRGELGPEAALADSLRDNAKTLTMIPDIIKRLDDQLPRKGGAPEAPPLPVVKLMWDKKENTSKGGFWRNSILIALSAAAGASAVWFWG